MAWSGGLGWDWEFWWCLGADKSYTSNGKSYPVSAYVPLDLPCYRASFGRIYRLGFIAVNQVTVVLDQIKHCIWTFFHHPLYKTSVSGGCLALVWESSGHSLLDKGILLELKWVSHPFDRKSLISLRSHTNCFNSFSPLIGLPRGPLCQ